MKKLLTILAVILIVGSTVNAQELGVRFGVATGGNVAIDGVFGIGSWKRIHSDVSFGDGVGIDLLWDFAYKQLGGEAFNWYAGVGPFTWLGSPFQLGVAGEIGIEYRFRYPISLSLDWRPSFIIIENTDFDLGVFGLNLRFVF